MYILQRVDSRGNNMKKIIFNLIMTVSTLALIILFILGTLFRNYIPTLGLGIPFIFLYGVTLYFKNKLINMKEVK